MTTLIPTGSQKKNHPMCLPLYRLEGGQKDCQAKTFGTYAENP